MEWICDWETTMSDACHYRFRNIVTEMTDCEDVIDELLNGVTDDGQPLPEEELRAARRLIACCIDLVTLVAAEAQIRVDLDNVEQSVDTVLRAANDAPLKARYDARAARLLLSKAAK
jgi:hypothetical protein